MPYKDKSVGVAKHKEWSRNHYEKTKEATKARVKKRKNDNRILWSAFKSTLKCVTCGQNHPATLDFHHTNPAEKENLVSKYVSNGGFTKAMKEAQKCIVLCANCHRIHHHNEKNPAL